MSCAVGPNVTSDGLVFAFDAANYKSFKGADTFNNSRDARNFSGITYASENEWTTDPTALSKTYVSSIVTPIGNGATLIQESGNNGYHHLSRFGGGGESGAHSLSCYVFLLTADITNFTIGMLGDGSNQISFNLNTRAITYGGGISNRDAFITPVKGFDGWYRIGANIEGRSGGWVGAIGYSTSILYTGISGNKRCYITGIQYEFKTKSTMFAEAQTTRGTTVATGGGWANLISGDNHGTLVNGVSEDNVDVGSLMFDGVDDYVVAQSPGSYPNYTFEFFCRWNIPTTFNRIFGLSNFGTYTILSPTNVGFHYNPAGGSPPSVTLSSNVNVGYGTWCHVAVTVNSSGNLVTIYINGVSRNSWNVLPSGNFSGNLYLGAQNTLGTVSNCNIGVFSLYNRALSAAEVQQNFNALRGRYGI